MPITPSEAWFLMQEARALLHRLGRVKPFALKEPMLPAAAITLHAQTGIETYLTRGRQELRAMVQSFMAWLTANARRGLTPAEAQQRFTVLRLRFNRVLTQFDLFNDVISQRSENETGVWLSGLDVAAADALALPGGYYDVPPLMCYLDRGVGAAIRRARTRLPGGGDNPVAIIRVPRERMIGSSIASSLFHEAGHQAAALLNLVPSLVPVLKGLQRGSILTRVAWELFERWISEIVADFWSVARVGITSTLGLMGVVSLPRVFVFRMGLEDPHPIPWIRVKISSAIGDALYPHQQWERLSRLWESFYPLGPLDEKKRKLLATLESTIPALTAVLIHHRPKSLRGRSLSEVLDTAPRAPAQLQILFARWQTKPWEMYRTSPSLVFAALGQARIEGKLSPEDEGNTLAKLLTHWALRSTLDASEVCANQPRRSALQMTTKLNLLAG